jgi:glucose/arabinose dehydrogenase
LPSVEESEELAGTRVAIEPAFPGISFEFPLAMIPAPAPGTDWFVVEKGGRIHRVTGEGDGATSTLFVDLTDRVYSGDSEMGLLGFAFDPDFAGTNLVYLSYNYLDDGEKFSRISSMTVDATTNVAIPSSESVILELSQPYGNHNGGSIAFGPDGFLYISFGDGGAAGDPENRAQNLEVLWGKMLRIDVHPADTTQPYAIPSDNPFAAGGGAPEIFAWGLRNVWKFSFDTQTGELWAGDVGQGEIEEVDIIRNGLNYGWRVFEGTTCYTTASACADLQTEDPVVEYSHAEGHSITGGFVYRGNSMPARVGQYIFGDFVDGKIWAVVEDPETGQPARELIFAAGGLNIAGFAQGHDGEMYVINVAAGPGGFIQKLIPATDP